jgi:hypothetical protein
MSALPWPARAKDRSFYLAMAVLVAAIVVYGFSFTFRDNLLHPPYPRPWILYGHAVLFSAWVPFFIAQAALVRSRRVDLHRRLGLLGLAFGGLIPVVGLATAVAMTRLRLAHGESEAAPSILIPSFDMLAFSSAFALGILWRGRPEFHRRLMLVATASLTAAAFGRMPAFDYGQWFYAGVDGLILIGALHDVWTHGRVHAVYRYALPAMILGQLLTAYVRGLPGWIALAPTLFR